MGRQQKIGMLAALATGVGLMTAQGALAQPAALQAAAAARSQSQTSAEPARPIAVPSNARSSSGRETLRAGSVTASGAIVVPSNSIAGTERYDRERSHLVRQREARRHTVYVHDDPAIIRGVHAPYGTAVRRFHDPGYPQLLETESRFARAQLRFHAASYPDLGSAGVVYRGPRSPHCVTRPVRKPACAPAPRGRHHSGRR